VRELHRASDPRLQRDVAAYVDDFQRTLSDLFVVAGVT
jgi:hypothetical protein